ncbi:hypothetical protein GLOIN_2v415082 [Rhizophagus irregularis DAOM 181602=DAOM 197198]|nr:hypothetical protein GLOIN_2v415082 [Rhizophagus irregularis DAOM 181602=DAOM 197198]
MEKRAEAIKLPADMGRIPNKISTGEGFFGFTADQWKTFILVYSTPIMWDLLSVNDREILGNFVRACSLLVCRIINTNKINEAHNRLLKIGQLIEEHYGENLITPNIHLSLHIAECCRDYGPIYSFWCYSFEQMNGILDSYPNSKRYIEPELLRIILIEPRQTTGSLAVYDDLRLEELVQFKWIFCSELEDTITGSEIYPDNLLSPIKNRVDLPDNLYEQLITYYNEVYGEKMDVEFGSMSNLISRGLQNNSYVVVQPIINQCGRIQVAAEIFRSALAPRYKKNSYILAKFTQDNESIELYPGMVQFYFEHVLRLPTIGERTHKLAYVKWYLPVNDHRIRFYCRAEQDDDRSVNIEL